MIDEKTEVNREEVLTRIERIAHGIKAAQLFGTSRAELLSDAQVRDALLEKIDETKFASSIFMDGHISLSTYEFCRLESMMPRLEAEGLVESRKSPGKERLPTLRDEDAEVFLTPAGQQILSISRALRSSRSGEALVLPISVAEIKGEFDEGALVRSCSPVWMSLLAGLSRDPDLLSKLHWRDLEEVVASAYDREGWDVILTPRSGDMGRDIIASRSDVGMIKIFDQVKAFSPGHRVSANDVRALCGVLRGNVSKGIVTTTSDFAPGIWEEFSDLMPWRIQLRNGSDLLSWIHSLAFSSE